MHCKYFDCTQYSFWQCYVSHCNLAAHVTAQNSNWSQTVLLNATECHWYSYWLWYLLPNYCGKCNTAIDWKLPVNIFRLFISQFSSYFVFFHYSINLGLALSSYDFFCKKLCQIHDPWGHIKSSFLFITFLLQIKILQWKKL